MYQWENRIQSQKKYKNDDSSSKYNSLNSTPIKNKHILKNSNLDRVFFSPQTSYSSLSSISTPNSKIKNNQAPSVINFL